MKTISITFRIKQNATIKSIQHATTVFPHNEYAAALVDGSRQHSIIIIMMMMMMLFIIMVGWRVEMATTATERAIYVIFISH